MPLNGVPTRFIDRNPYEGFDKCWPMERIRAKRTLPHFAELKVRMRATVQSATTTMAEWPAAGGVKVVRLFCLLQRLHEGSKRHRLRSCTLRAVDQAADQFAGSDRLAPGLGPARGKYV